MDETPANRSLWTRRTMWLVAGLLVCRMGYLAFLPLDLCPDEAYYWDWSRQLDWGYYSKPPMIAWIIAAATSLGGPAEFVVRLPAALLGTLGSVAVFGLARSQFSARVGFWSVLAINLTPGITAMNMLMTIDAPFLCAWAFGVWTAWELLSRPEPGWKQVGLAVVATGLGLLCKQTMLALFPLTGLWLLLQAEHRRKLLSPKIWVWWCGSLVFLTPVVLWNAQHDWITVQHTTEHFQNKTVPLTKHVVWMLEFWAGQFGVVSPIACGLMLMIAGGAMKSLHRLDQRVRFLLCLGFVPMLGVTMLSLQQRVQPNWPAPFWLTSFVLLAAWGCEAIPRLGLRGDPFRWLMTSTAIGLVLMLGLWIVPFTVPGSSLAGSPIDATARLRGWREMGQRVSAEVADLPQTSERLYIAVTGRGPVSALAFYLPEHPRVYRWNPTGIVESQHEVWGGPQGDHHGAEAIVVTHKGQPVPPALENAFDDVTLIAETTVHLGGERYESLQLWRGIHYRDWPNPHQNLQTAARPAKIATTAIK